ncbi:MAG: hypothetical protein IJW99_06275 [Clostridia bacterium]|nr:hypothetical protein [Clostridia bacterium]
MKNILLIGVGGTGSNAVEIFFRKYEELGAKKNSNTHVAALVFDTDVGDLARIQNAKTIAMAENCTIGDVCDRIGPNYLEEWFPCADNFVRSQEMVKGASQWRKKSYLAFLNLMNKSETRQTFHSALEEMTLQRGTKCEIYVIASVAGGTGSGSFIPIALYAKQYLQKKLGEDPIVNAMIALPDIYADSQSADNRTKIYANAYAIMRELNAINLVTRGYNKEKQSPIQFRIGHPDEPNVGLLFDSSDPNFWTPEAAPFSQIFVLDRIPAVNSIQAHDLILANSLYTMLCTDIGVAFDSEMSNHEMTRSQNNAGNAIYASASTAQIRFPQDTVMEYLACEKTLAACDSEWLTIHKAVETAIDELEQQKKATKSKLVLTPADYAKMFLNKVDEKCDENCNEVIEIVERGIYRYDPKTGEALPDKKTHGMRYLEETVDPYVDSCVPSAIPTKERLLNEDFEIREKKRLFSDETEAEIVVPKGSGKDEFHALACHIRKERLLPYYKQCVQAMQVATANGADRFLTFDRAKLDCIGDVSALEHRLLCDDDGKTYIHPVAAMIRLCQLREALESKLPKTPYKPSADLRKRRIDEIPADICRKVANAELEEKSLYASMGANRFVLLTAEEQSMPEGYEKGKTKLEEDYTVLKNDSESILNRIYGQTLEEIRNCIYTHLAENVDVLIAKYRKFFDRFEKEKALLADRAKGAYGRDCGTVDSLINVCSAMAHKDMLLKKLQGSATIASESSTVKTDHIAGKGVFHTIFTEAVADFAVAHGESVKELPSFNQLFDGMVDAYAEEISKDEGYRKIAECNVLEAMVESCGEDANNLKAVETVLYQVFKDANAIAKPSLQLRPATAEEDLVDPTLMRVYMVSTNVARYIKINAERFHLSLSNGDGSDAALVRSCVEQFIRRYSGEVNARVVIVDSIPDTMIYCTGEIIDITPLRVAKFDELGAENTYFKQYTTALANAKKYNTDMWNPHLGFDLHLRANLPYMNPRKEQEGDDKTVKAVLYALSTDKITYGHGIGSMGDQSSFKKGTSSLYNQVQAPITETNIAHLLSWMREQEELIEEWSEAYDRKLDGDMKKLPNVIGQSDIRELEGNLTKSPFMWMLNEELYTVSNKSRSKTKTVSAFAFAYNIKVTEENDRDCNDAERVLRVLYQSFLKMIEHRTSPKRTPDIFVTVYKQQLEIFYEKIAGSALVQGEKIGAPRVEQFAALAHWLNAAGFFCEIDPNKLFHANGEFRITDDFNYEKHAAIRKLLLGQEEMTEDEVDSETPEQ